MNTLTAPQRPDRRPADIPDSLQHLPLQDRTPRTSLLDRIALRLALTLLLWSTRPLRPAVSAVQRQAERDREQRERTWQLRCHRLPLL